MTCCKRTGFEMQREFHETFGHPVSEFPGFIGELSGPEKAVVKVAGKVLAECQAVLTELSDSRRGLRINLLIEELGEYLLGEADDDLDSTFDGLVDIAVIAEGTALEYGLPYDAGRQEIHRANMSKLGEDGKPIHREDGKIMKGPNYVAPDLKSLIDSARLEFHGTLAGRVV